MKDASLMIGSPQGSLVMRFPISTRQFCALLALAVLGPFGVAEALDSAPIPLIPPLSGSTYFALGGITEALDPDLAGLDVYDVLQPFSFGPSATAPPVTGDIQVRVVRESGTGTLDFYWRVLDNADSGGDIIALRLGGFGSNSLTADYRTDGSGSTGPDMAQAFGGAFLGYVNFLFDTPVTPGESSYFFFLHTTATSFTGTGMYDLIDGAEDISDEYTAQVPGTSVPEPATLALLGLGLAGIALARRRRLR